MGSSPSSAFSFSARSTLSRRTLLHLEIVDGAATHGLVADRAFVGRRGFRHGHNVALLPATSRRFLNSCSLSGHYECAIPCASISDNAIAPAFDGCSIVPYSLFTLFLLLTFPCPLVCLGFCLPFAGLLGLARCGHPSAFPDTLGACDGSPCAPSLPCP